MSNWKERLDGETINKVGGLTEKFILQKIKLTEAEVLLFTKVTDLGLTDQEADQLINSLTGE